MDRGWPISRYDGLTRLELERRAELAEDRLALAVPVVAAARRTSESWSTSHARGQSAFTDTLADIDDALRDYDAFDTGYGGPR